MPDYFFTNKFNPLWNALKIRKIQRNNFLEEKESGEFFYGLLHKRYVLTNGGIEKLLKSYEKGNQLIWLESPHPGMVILIDENPFSDTL